LLGEFGRALEKFLIRPDGQPVDLMAGREKAPMYYLFYESGSWCGPCREFTPSVVKFYSEVKERKGNVEVILIPRETDKESASKYAREFGIDFPVVRFENVFSSDFADLVGKGSRGVPSLRLVDSSGKTILSEGTFDVLRAAGSRSIKPSED